MTAKLVVFGSSNTDMVIRTEKLPSPGQTILGGQFLMNTGGKGANQAVAAQRLGASVIFVSKVGNDLFGNQIVESLEGEGISLDFISTTPEFPSGVAMITVDENGENSIVVSQGANNELTPGDCSLALSGLNQSSIVLLQLEIPMETVEYIVKTARGRGSKVILNPAPAQTLSDELLQDIYLISPNESEAEQLTGIPVKDQGSTRKAAEKLKGKGAEVVVITMGEVGAFVLSDEFTGVVAAPKVQAIDTTAAGDTFNGALVASLSEYKSIHESVQFACNAASISVTRMGAQTSIPYRNELSK